MRCRSGAGLRRSFACAEMLVGGAVNAEVFDIETWLCPPAFGCPFLGGRIPQARSPSYIWPSLFSRPRSLAAIIQSRYLPLSDRMVVSICNLTVWLDAVFGSVPRRLLLDRLGHSNLL
ncbi:hypothetical protein OE88DRAFT_1356498 [Heliocybe sulcata]|uniref:Uncharacterized protein n=1 Tax=Heliocybe sulcata TaxID=5364 RepID=A0A5C3N7F0_9AGAM|nr:hypothetical protein OE88DRAFT_1356498 [Heliocybe sulcata]